MSLKNTLNKLKKNTNNSFVYNVNNSWYSFKEFFNKHSTLKYCLKRIFISLICLFFGFSIIFILIRKTTNDDAFLPAAADKFGWTNEQKIEYLKNRLSPIGLYGSIWSQLWHFWYNILPFIPKKVPYDFIVNPVNGVIISEQFETKFVYFGITISNVISPGQDVGTMFKNAIPYSFAFGALTIAISYIIGVPLGIYAAMKKNKISGSFLNGLSLFIYSIPTVIIVLFLFIIPVAIFSQSKVFFSGSFWSKFWPEMTMCVLFMPIITIMTRRYFVEELNNEYVRYAFAKGVSNNKVFFKHIFRNTSTVIIRDIPRDLGLAIFGFSMITESQWKIPGVGSLAIKALTPGDTDPLTILAFVVLAGVTITITTLLSDLIMVLLDPRIKLGRSKN